MNRVVLRLLVTLVLAGLVACGGGDSGREAKATTSAGLAMPTLTPVPTDPVSHKKSWNGTPVELMFADAFASCAFTSPPFNPYAPISFKDDEYLEYIKLQMAGAYSVGQCQSGTSSQVELRWVNQRNDQACNVDPSTGTAKSTNLANTPPVVSVPIVSPFSGAPNADLTASFATRALQVPLTNSCIAQRLRARSPGASAGEALLLSAADQRQLLALVKDRSQMAMLQLALLGRVFSTAPEPSPGTVADGFPLNFIPMLQHWAQTGNPTITLPAANGSPGQAYGALELLGRELAAVVRLHTTVAQEFAQLLNRSGAARLARGASPTDPKWAASEQHGGAIDVWGPGSWRQRAMAALYGGDPLVEDPSGSTPWRHFKRSSRPGETGTRGPKDWPTVEQAPFVATSIDDPKVLQLLSLARTADALYLRKTDGDGWKDTYEKIRCHGVVRAASAARLYRATEAHLRTNACVSYAPVTNTCKAFALAEIPDPSQGYSDFELWKRHRITPEQAESLVAWLDEVSGKECLRDAHEWPGGAYERQSDVEFFRRGGLDFSGDIRSVELTDGAYYHLSGYQVQPRLLREVGGLFAGYSNFQIPRQISPKADPITQGFQVGASVSFPKPGAPHEEMRLMGAIPALAATREALLDSVRELATPPLASFAMAVQPFFAKKELILSTIDAAIGATGVSILPSATVEPAPWSAIEDWRILKPSWTERIVDVTIDADDPFWSAALGDYRLHVVPNDNLIDSMVVYNPSGAFRGGVINAIGNNPRHKSSIAPPVAISPPAGVSSPPARRFVIEVNPSDEGHSLIIERMSTHQFRSVAANVESFSYYGGDNPWLFDGHPRGQYLSFGGSLGSLAVAVTAVDLINPAKPASDGFGLPNAWLPPTDPALFGGAAGDDAVASYLRKARAAAEEATTAVKEAFDEMLKTQEDEAALGAAVAKAEKVEDLQRSALCGRRDCNTTPQIATVSAQAIWDSKVGPAYAWNVARQQCRSQGNESFSEMLAAMLAGQRVRCLVVGMLGKANTRVRVLDAVKRLASAPEVPPFLEYGGGTLQEVAVEQWTSIRSLEDRIRALIVAMDASITHIQALDDHLKYANDQERIMAKRCLKMEESIVRLNCDNVTVKPNPGGPVPQQYGVCTLDQIDPSEMDWSHESVVSDSTGASSSMGGSVGVAVGLATGFNFGNASSEGQSTTPVPVAQQYRMCQAYKYNAREALWRAFEGAFQAYSNIQDRASEMTDAVGRVRRAEAAGMVMLHQADLAVARHKLDVDLLRSSQVTSFGLYRQVHSYDAWRAKALLDGARVSAAVARKAIESRYVVNLSELTAPEPLVASPASWADEVYEYDLDMPAAVGLSVGEATSSGIYANRVLDYVGNLERFVNGFSIARPTAVARGDTEVISLPGPRGFGNGAASGGGLFDGRAHAWTYLCSNGDWRSASPTGNVSEVCGAPPSRPIRASVLFDLDPWGRLSGDIAQEPFERRHNARWERLAVNVVGTGVLDCSKAADSSACYTQPFVRYRLSHRGAPWVTNSEQRWTLLPVPSGQIEAAKALAAEQWLDPVSNSWTKPYVNAVTRSEFDTRPLGGAYEILFDLGPEVVLERIERLQLLAGSSYWVRQGSVSEPRPADPVPDTPVVQPEWADLTPLADWDASKAEIFGAIPQRVSEVPDSSGHGHVLIGIPSLEPDFIATNPSFNGKPTLSFPVGTVKRAGFMGLGSPPNSPVTVVIVGSTPRTITGAGQTLYAMSWMNEQAAIGVTSGMGAGTRWMGWLSSTKPPFVWSNASGAAPSVVMATAGPFGIGQRQSFYVNALSPSEETPSSGLDWSGPGIVGGYGADDGTLGDFYTFGGDIARILIFDTVLTPAQRTSCMNALGAKYGITISN